MRYFELFEAEASSIRYNVYYHGTPAESNAKEIIRHGLRPPDFEAEGRKNSMMRPVEGHVYLTPHIAYAQMYAIGGNYAGDEHLKVPFEGNEERFKYIWSDTGRHAGRFGFLFVVPRANLIRAMQPDEDSIGQLYGYLLNGGPTEFHDVHDTETWNNLVADKYGFEKFKQIMDFISTDNEKRRIKEGEYAYYAKVGKKALANYRFDDELKATLVRCGCHVAHFGIVEPSECWKIDKAKVGWLEKNGSNFFKLADRIR